MWSQCVGVTRIVRAEVVPRCPRYWLAVRMLAVVIAVTSASPGFAQFGGSLDVFEARLGTPTKKMFLCELDELVPKIAGNQAKAAPLGAMTRWELSAGGPTMSVWTNHDEIHGLNFVENIPENTAKSYIGMMKNTVISSEGAAKSKLIAWQSDRDLMKPFARIAAPVEKMLLNKVVPPRAEANPAVSAWFDSDTGENLRPEVMTQPKLATNELVEVELFKSWRRVIVSDPLKQFVAVYDAYDFEVWQAAVQNKPRTNLLQSSTVGSFQVMKTPLYLASQVRLAENIRSGDASRSEYINQVQSRWKTSDRDKFYAAQLRAAVDHPDVPMEWLNLNYVAPLDLKKILESEFVNPTPAKKIRRIDALAQQGVLADKLVPQIIKELKNEKTRDAARDCLKNTADKLKRAPPEDLDDVSEWSEWADWLENAKRDIKDRKAGNAIPASDQTEKTKQ